MMRTCVFIVAIFLASEAGGRAPVVESTSTPAKVLSAQNSDASRATIKQAVQQGDLDTMFLALQKYVEPIYCLDQIEFLPRAKQAQLLARILSDKDILITAPSENAAPPAGSATLNSSMPGVIKRMSYQLLGEQPPPGLGWMTRSQMDALAARLRAVQ